jgi:Flp pilus assembly protein TadB
MGLTVVGVVIALVTGWAVVAVLLPALGVGLPYLVGKTKGSTDIAKLEAMEEWTRSLAGILVAGAGVEQAIVSTLPSAPKPIADEVSRLVARLRARWPATDALRAFADDLNDPTGDIVAANLLLGVTRRGQGLASILEGLSESVALDIRARRAVEADQAKPRATARWVTVITLVVLVLLWFSGTYVEAYKTPMGQVVLLGLLMAYSAVLVWMKRMATGQPLPRFLGKP